MERTLQSAAVGAAAGAVATVAMSAAMAVFDVLGPLDSQPPREITSRTLLKAGVGNDPKSTPVNVLSAFAHLGFGAAAGAVYAPLDERLGGPSVARGMAWATLVWATSYLKVLPALGLQPGPRRNAPRLIPMLIAHWVYGGVLAWLVDRATRFLDERAAPRDDLDIDPAPDLVWSASNTAKVGE